MQSTSRSACGAWPLASSSKWRSLSSGASIALSSLSVDAQVCDLDADGASFVAVGRILCPINYVVL